MKGSHFSSLFAVVAFSATVILFPSNLLGAATERAGRSPGFTVLQVTPTGRANLDDTISVEFSSDVVSTETLETSRTAEDVLQFDPSIDGTAIWESTRKVRFATASGLRPGTVYAMRISRGLRSLAGERLAGKTEFEFRTAPLALLRVEQTGFTQERRAIVELRFSDRIRPVDLQKFLAVSSAGQRLGWSIENDVVTNAPRVVTDVLTTDILSVRLERGLRGVSGPLPMENPVDRRVPLKFKLVLEKITARWVQDKPSLRLKFSNSVRLDDIKKFIRIEPELSFEVTEEAGSELTLWAAFQPQKRYTVFVSKGLMGYNNQLLLTDEKVSAWIPKMRPFLRMKDAGGHLSTKGGMKLRIESVGLKDLKLEAEQVFENNLAYFALQGEGRSRFASLGHEVAKKTIKVEGDLTQLTESPVDLRELLKDAGTGVFLLRASAEQPEGDTEEDSDEYSYEDYGWEYGYSRSRLRDSAVIAVSNIGILAKKSGRQMLVWVASLDSAQPIAGARVSAISRKNQLLKETTTGEDGVAVFDNLDENDDGKPQVVICSKDRDMTFLSLQHEHSMDFNFQGRDFLSAGYEAFLSPERGAYRPGEVIHLFGHVRGRGMSVPRPFPVELEVERPDDKRMEPRLVTLNSSGTLNYDLRLPTFAPTGLYTVRLQMAGTAQRREERLRHDDYSERENEVLGSATFFIEDFMPNRLKVETSAPEKRFSNAEPLAVQVKASEMFGQPAPGRSVTAVASFSSQPFAPEKYRDFAFGDSQVKFAPTEEELDEVVLGADGTTSLTVKLPEQRAPAAIAVRVQVTVKDVGGRGVTSLVRRTLDPVAYYIGTRTKPEQPVVVGKEALVDVVAVRPDETLVESAELSSTIFRVRYQSVLKREDNRFRFVSERELLPVHNVTARITSGTGTIAWTPAEAGEFLLQVGDSSGRITASNTIYVRPPQWTQQPWSLEEPERLEITADKNEYRPGEQARLLVKAPFGGTLFLTLEQDRVVTSSLHQMAQNTAEIVVPIEARHLPNIYCAATVLRPVRPEEKWMPHRANGATVIRISGESRKLAVDLQAPQEIRPDTTFTVSALVRDVLTSGAAESEITVWAVDEGVLSLTEFETPDAQAFFHAQRRLMVETYDFFSDLMPDLLSPNRVQAKSHTGGGEMGEGKRLSPVSAERVKPVSLWLGTLRTDAEGSATTTFRVPQFMGSLRVMAVAAAGEKFGRGDRELFVRNPIMVKENLPRFLAPGDVAEVPFVIYNNTDSEAEARLAVETSGPIKVLREGSRELGELVKVSARGMHPVIVKLQASDVAGSARLKFLGEMGTERFANEVELPVRPPSPMVQISGFDVLPAGETKVLSLPEVKFLAGTTTGAIAISDSSALPFAGALLHNVHYPYGCAEQTVSSAFPLIWLPELAERLDPGRFTRSGIMSMVQGGIDRLLSMQLGSGAIGMWQGDQNAWPWASIYAAHFLVEAKKGGYEFPEASMRELLSYIAARLGVKEEGPRAGLDTEKAYATYVLALAGRPVPERMDQLFQSRESLPTSAKCFLASAYLLAGGRNEALAILGVPSIDSISSNSRETGGVLASPVRDTAVLLATLVDVQPDSPLIPALVDRLQKRLNKAGHWGTTQENAFALWAMGKFAKLSSSPAEFSGKVEIAGASHDFSSSAPVTLSCPVDGGKVTVSASGSGKAYCHWAVEGVPLKPENSTVTQGLKIWRRYCDRGGNPLDPDALPQGKLVVVEVHVDAKTHLENVVIEDLLPACLEIENPNLASAEEIEDRSDRSKGVRVRRTDARDDRMIAFVDIWPNRESADNDEEDGAKSVFRYAARVVTAGEFVLPPIQGSCMYDPDVSALSPGGKVTARSMR